MSAFYRIDAASRTIFWELEGAVTDNELIEAAEMLWADPEYRSEYSRLLDGTKAAPTRLSGDVVRWIALRNSREGVGKTALVAGGDAMYGMMRMYQICSDGMPCQAFRNRALAVAWLLGDKATVVEAAAATGAS
jgi:hypothetical protein